LFSYIRPYRRFIVQLFVGLLVGSILQLIFPFLTQSIVDKGINARNLDFVYLVLIAQLMLFVSQTSVEFIRSWIFLHISTRVNISLISDFLIKLLKLPIGFFDSKMIGDIMQRIGDHGRIENFLTSASLNILFSMINLVIFGVVLAIYDMTIFLVFFLASLFYVAWVVVFMKKRRELDFKRFAQLSDNQSNLIQLITGIQEIKLNNCEKQKRWGWERIQAKLFRVNVKSLSLGQYQQSGALFINQLKNIFISFYAAKGVIDGDMTLGMMMAVQYIIGQLNSPIEQLIGFMHALQDAKISLERLSEIHQKDDEERPSGEQISDLPVGLPLVVRDLSFHYEGPHSERVLHEINLTIPAHKVTAIVGMSGSGKTTLIKLFLGFYPPTKGEIRVGDYPLGSISQRAWRQRCGVVMQDGFIFSDTISRNIAVSDESIDRERLQKAVQVANIGDLIESLPLGYNTKIGMEGHGLSQGQKQRILIARAVYKNPDYLFFDEATNALDANNERVIMENLGQFFAGRTVVVVAHRLSTVRDADQIVVLEKGQVVELGTHTELTAKRGAYYQLVKNQLELGQ
jgi:ATP-binding cassette subfamily B protein